MGTLDKRGSSYGFYSSFGSKRNHHHKFHHPYRRNEKQYFLEFRKVNPPTFDGEMKKSKDAEAWLLGIKNLFGFHDYLYNIKAKISIFNLKGKEDIWWEDVKHIIGIKVEELSWHEFKRLFQNKYLPKRYYEGKA